MPSPGLTWDNARAAGIPKSAARTPLIATCTGRMDRADISTRATGEPAKSARSASPSPVVKKNFAMDCMAGFSAIRPANAAGCIGWCGIFWTQALLKAAR